MFSSSFHNFSIVNANMIYYYIELKILIRCKEKRYTFHSIIIINLFYVLFRFIYAYIIINLLLLLHEIHLEKLSF